ncbi:hypothetical protein N7541_006753 [Penicillium brevicompactum]|uniref:Uncharacterized protein n=1 Tax=Penicillium brevicompactum TaxID=5074 RepID=A0A9W9URT4_PENBR|nr:hypothetical protein N7541_006753 [Penicillium brevicompactum]
MSASMDVKRCYRVLEQADLEYDGKEEYITVYANPKVIIHSPMTALWAQSNEGEKKINMKHAPPQSVSQGPCWTWTRSGRYL